MPRRYVARTIVLVAVLAFAVLLARAPRTLNGGTRWIGRIQRPLTAATMGVAAWFGAVGRTVRDPGRVAALEREITELHAQQAVSTRTIADLQGQLEERAAEPSSQPETLTRASVVAGTFSGSRRLITVEYAPRHAVNSGSPVLAHGALVGVVEESGSSRAVVRLLNDPQMRIGVEAATRRGAIGVLEADTGFGIVVTHIPIDRIVATGDAIVTGITNDGIPSGIPIGTIVAIRTDSDGFFQTGIIDVLVDPRQQAVVTILEPSA